MDQLYFSETKIVDVAAYPFDKEPFFAMVILFALLILYVVYSRRKHNDESSTINGYIANYNVLGLPVEPIANDLYSKEGILFNTNSEISLFKSLLHCILAVSLFGAIIIFLSFSFGNQVGCVIL